MNAAQLGKYRFEWKLTRRWLRAHGRTPAQADAMRHAIHRQELGRDKSSLDLNNDEITKVLRAFKAIYDGGNLQAQLDANADPERRVAELRQKIEHLAEQCGVVGESLGLESYFKNWFQGRTYDRLEERDLQVLAGMLERREKQLVKASEDDPF